MRDSTLPSEANAADDSILNNRITRSRTRAAATLTDQSMTKSKTSAPLAGYPSGNDEMDGDPVREEDDMEVEGVDEEDTAGPAAKKTNGKRAIKATSSKSNPKAKRTSSSQTSKPKSKSKSASHNKSIKQAQVPTTKPAVASRSQRTSKRVTLYPKDISSTPYDQEDSDADMSNASSSDLSEVPDDHISSVSSSSSSASSSEDEDDYAPTRQLTLSNLALKARKRSLKLKQLEVQKAERRIEKKQKEMEEEEVERLEAMGWKEGQRIGFMDLPVEIIERCLSLEQDLDLVDHVSISQCCHTLREAYDEIAWESLYMLSVSENDFRDTFTLSAQPSMAESQLGIGSHRVSFERGLYCLRKHQNRAEDFCHRSMRFQNVTVEGVGRISMAERLVAIMEEYNELIWADEAPPKLSWEGQYRRKHNGQNYVYRPRWPNTPEPDETDDEKTARLAKEKVVDDREGALITKHEQYTTRVSYFQTAYLLPLTRGEFVAAGRDEYNLPIRARALPYGPFQVLVLRALNFPVYTLLQAMRMTQMSNTELVKYIEPVAKELVRAIAGTDYFFEKDVDRLISQTNPLTLERSAKKAADQQAASAKSKLDYEKQQRHLKRAGRPVCICRKYHPVGPAPCWQMKWQERKAAEQAARVAQLAARQKLKRLLHFKEEPMTDDEDEDGNGTLPWFV